MNVFCARCGEAFEAAYFHVLMSDAQAARFWRRQGCPACDFGRCCPECNGSKLEACYKKGGDCPLCLGKRWLLARRITNPDPDMDAGWRLERWPHDIQLPGEPINPRKRETYPVQKGIYTVEAVICDCPRCATNPDLLKCSACGGDGQLHKTEVEQDDLLTEFLDAKFAAQERRLIEFPPNIDPIPPEQMAMPLGLTVGDVLAVGYGATTEAGREAIKEYQEARYG